MIGNYVRTIQGYIGKIERMNDCGTYFTEKFGFNSGEIVKHSKNIIDLIEVRRYCKNI